MVQEQATAIPPWTSGQAAAKRFLQYAAGQTTQWQQENAPLIESARQVVHGAPPGGVPGATAPGAAPFAPAVQAAGQPGVAPLQGPPGPPQQPWGSPQPVPERAVPPPVPGAPTFGGNLVPAASYETPPSAYKTPPYVPGALPEPAFKVASSGGAGGGGPVSSATPLADKEIWGAIHNIPGATRLLETGGGTGGAATPLADKEIWEAILSIPGARRLLERGGAAAPLPEPSIPVPGTPGTPGLPYTGQPPVGGANRWGTSTLLPGGMFQEPLLVDVGFGPQWSIMPKYVNPRYETREDAAQAIANFVETGVFRHPGGYTRTAEQNLQHVMEWITKAAAGGIGTSRSLPYNVAAGQAFLPQLQALQAGTYTPPGGGAGGGAGSVPGGGIDFSNLPVVEQLKSGQPSPAFGQIQTMDLPELGIEGLPTPAMSASTFRQFGPQKQADALQLWKIGGIQPEVSGYRMNRATPGWKPTRRRTFGF